MRTAATVALVLVLSGCVTPAIKAAWGPVPQERATECATVCAGLGMKLGAVVVITNRTGCVCEPAGATPGNQPGASAAAAGAIIALEEEEEAQRQAVRRR